MAALFRQFSFPGGIPSRAAPETPGSIHEGGELGYSLAHAYGAAFDNPALIVACVIGDGEAETGPLASSWHSSKFLDPAQPPDVVSAFCGDTPTLEALAAVPLLREHLPALRARVVNAIGLIRLQPESEHPHGMTDAEFDTLFTTDRPVIFRLPRLPAADLPADLPAARPLELPIDRVAPGLPPRPGTPASSGLCRARPFRRRRSSLK